MTVRSKIEVRAFENEATYSRKEEDWNWFEKNPEKKCRFRPMEEDDRAAFGMIPLKNALLTKLMALSRSRKGSEVGVAVIRVGETTTTRFPALKIGGEYSLFFPAEDGSWEEVDPEEVATFFGEAAGSPVLAGDDCLDCGNPMESGGMTFSFLSLPGPGGCCELCGNEKMARGEMPVAVGVYLAKNPPTEEDDKRLKKTIEKIKKLRAMQPS